jgi:hypothetical protein
MRTPERALLKRAVTIQMVRIKIPSGASGAVEQYCELWPDVNPYLAKGNSTRPWSALPRRPLRRVPRRALPRGASRARGRVLHSSRVEGRAPAALVVPGELEIVALARHPEGDVADAGPGVEPPLQRREGAAVARLASERSFTPACRRASSSSVVPPRE